MITARTYFGASVVGDTILVMGGYVGQGFATNKVEAYSGDTRVWTPYPDMPIPSTFQGCVTVSGLTNAKTYSSQKIVGLY